MMASTCVVLLVSKERIGGAVEKGVDMRCGVDRSQRTQALELLQRRGVYQAAVHVAPREALATVLLEMATWDHLAPRMMPR